MRITVENIVRHVALITGDVLLHLNGIELDLSLIYLTLLGLAEVK